MLLQYGGSRRKMVYIVVASSQVGIVIGLNLKPTWSEGRRAESERRTTVQLREPKEGVELRHRLTASRTDTHRHFPRNGSCSVTQNRTLLKQSIICPHISRKCYVSIYFPSLPSLSLSLFVLSTHSLVPFPNVLSCPANLPRAQR